MAEVEGSRSIAAEVDGDDRVVQERSETVKKGRQGGFNVAREALCEAYDARELSLALEARGDDLSGLNWGIKKLEAAHAQSVEIYNAVGMGPVHWKAIVSEGYSTHQPFKGLSTYCR